MNDTQKYLSRVKRRASEKKKKALADEKTKRTLKRLSFAEEDQIHTSKADIKNMAP